MWDLPRPGLEPVSPALAGRLSTTAPPGKPCHGILCQLPEARSLMFPFLPYAGDCQGFLELLKSQSLQREAGTLSALSKARRTEVGTRGLSVESPRHGSGALQQRPPPAPPTGIWEVSPWTKAAYHLIRTTHRWWASAYWLCLRPHKGYHDSCYPLGHLLIPEDRTLLE